MKFVKMNGLGNDYIYVNCFEEKVENPSELSVRLSNRNFGIGSDGLILIKPSEVADFKMEMYNADGSQAEMCGNGIRCVAKFVYDYKLTNRVNISIETLGGIKYLELTVKDGKAVLIKVDMGEAILDPELIPIVSKNKNVINEPIEVDGKTYHITGVSMGNPHAVVFMDDLDTLEIEQIGPKFESNDVFPKRVNTEFIQVTGENKLKMRVWERGSGETLACGTGACAAAVAAILNNLASGKEKVIVTLLGGDLEILWDQEKNRVYMTGPAEVSFEGEVVI